MFSESNEMLHKGTYIHGLLHCNIKNNMNILNKAFLKLSYIMRG